MNFGPKDLTKPQDNKGTGECVWAIQYQSMYIHHCESPNYDYSLLSWNKKGPHSKAGIFK